MQEVGAIIEGFISAKDTMKKLLADETEKETPVEEQQGNEKQGDDSTVEDNT